MVYVLSTTDKVGNVFKSKDGTPLVKRIALDDVFTTVEWLETITQLPIADNLLGSAGKKQSSGDLDIAVDLNTITKDQLTRKLLAVSDAAAIKRSGISVHFRAPINGDAANGHVQVDFMFVDNMPLAKFGLYSAGDASKFTGTARNILMCSLTKAISSELRYSWQKGLVNTTTNTVVTTDPDSITKILLGASHTLENMTSVETILDTIKNDRFRLAALKALCIRLRDTNDKTPAVIANNKSEADNIELMLQQVFLKVELLGAIV
jgi:hypothetical protein